MDGIYREGEYRSLLAKLNALSAKGQSDSSEKLDLLQSEVNGIIELLRNRSDQSNARIHYFLLLIPLVLALMWSVWISGNITNNLLLLLVLLICIGLIHLRMSHSIKRSHNAHKLLRDAPNDSKNFILTKLNYLDYALDIKKTRMVLVCVFYFLFFPILLVKLHTSALDSTPFNSYWLAYGIGYLISGILWYFYFNKSFQIYDRVDEKIDLIRKSL